MDRPTRSAVALCTAVVGAVIAAAAWEAWPARPPPPLSVEALDAALRASSRPKA